MINLNRLNGLRIIDHAVVERYGDVGDECGGCFELASPIDKQPLVVIASSALGWDHVSVSRRNRIPNQTELDYVYRTFFEPGETAVQYFVPRDEHVNIHPHCLHLWRPHEPLKKPPRGFV